MPVELVPALSAGLVAGLAMFAAQVAVAAARGREAFVIAYWSTLVGLRGQAARIGGVVIHLLVSVGVATGYALGFSLGAVDDMGWAWGLVGGVIHWVAAGAFVAVVPGTPDPTAGSPGAFGRELGPNGGIVFLAAHLVFGLVAGFVYLLLHSSGGLNAAL